LKHPVPPSSVKFMLEWY